MAFTQVPLLDDACYEARVVANITVTAGLIAYSQVIIRIKAWHTAIQR
jgi:hypothetical protein